MPASGKDDLPWLSRPLAIVGMACRLPGGDGLSEFWHLLSTGGYAIESMPDSKLNRGLYYNPEKGVRGKTYSDIGGFVAERDLDWDSMNLDPQEAANWDPCHLNLCEVAAKAVLHAGYEPSSLRDSRVGVFVGHSGGTTLGGELAYGTLAKDYVDVLRKVLANESQIGGPGREVLCKEVLDALKAERPVRREAKPFVDASYASALVSKVLGLRGPSISIDAACASSLVALALAANSLQSGESEAAIVGGASYNKSDSLILFSHAQSCSADGSRPFDQAANGLISSEGYVTLLVKTLEKAEQDGDTIQAVICGIGASSDGRGRSLWAPRKEGQYTAIERAYSDSVSPSSVQMIEAHATSTRVGDATEMEALAGFYSQHLSTGRRLPVGSVKSNIGHTLETAGLAGLVKAILSIQNQVIPPSVNLERPSDAIQWSDIPLYVPTQAEPWDSPSDGMNRRAAVNAFGIGGLNVHVVVEEYQKRTANSVAEQLTPTVNADRRPVENMHSAANRPKANHSVAKQSFADAEPAVAVVGRGLVLPEFLSVTALAEYLTRGAMSGATEAYGRGKPSEGGQIGRISGFQYDWRKHKVPPKQIAQANPLQFMLLEAAEQALTEAGIIDQKFDRQKTAVVVGSPFGGDFGNALYAGLRLPEFRAKLVEALSSRMVDRSEIEKVVIEFEAEFLRNWPALTDETGSFTSSTLASRLSKTFDLMGGAMALDAGDCSGAAALSVACQLLQGGTVNQVLCAAAHSALDAAAIDNLQQLGRFPEVAGTSVRQPVVGEGVVLLLLKRKVDAERDGNRCFTTIDRIGTGFHNHSLEKAVAEAASCIHAGTTRRRLVGALELPSLDQAVCDGIISSSKEERQRSSSSSVSFEKSLHCKHTGYLQATQPLADLVEQSLLLEQNPSTQKQLIASHTFSGLSYLIDTAEKNPMHADSNTRQNERPAEANTRVVEASELIEVFRFESDSLSGLKAALDGTASTELGDRSKTKFSGVTYRAAVVCARKELVPKIGKLKVALENPQLLNALSANGIYARVSGQQTVSGKSPGSLKTAWLFPGQGSQSRGMLQELVAHDPQVALDLETANRHLAEMGQPSFQEMAWSASTELGEDIWHTQASMLIADWLLGQQLRRLGHAPAVVSGHSYGELPAMLFAGCWSLENALKATWLRCKSIVDNVPAGFSMLSVQADRSRTESFIEEFAAAVEISHLNAPNQTVVGGRRAAVADFAQRLEEQGGASRILAVPTAFHTSALQPACEPFLDALQAIPIDVPETPFLSSVSNKYVADPHEIRANLAKQLTTRLDFVGLMERLVADGVRTVVEVGPGRVLSQLTQRISDKLDVVTMDAGSLGASEQVLRLSAQLELSDCVPQETPQKTMMSKQISNRMEPKEPVHFDATQLRKQNRRLQSRKSGTVARNEYSSTLGQTAHFDATDIRRKANAARAESHGIAGASLAASNVSAEKNEFIQESSVPASKPAVQENVGTTSGSSQAAIEGFLIDFVVEQTGYPPEIIEIDWDMEADLGIDSIKKAQLFGELREFFDLEVHSQLSLDEFRSLRDIVNLLLRTPGKGAWSKQLNEIPPASQHAPVDVTSAAPAEPNDQVQVQESEQANSDDLVAEFTGLLVDFVVEQTGYPPEIIELDADLEADLGIDSIKKAQLLGELGEMFTLDFVSDSSEMPLAKVGDELRTLRAILDFLLKHTSVNDRVELATNESAGSSASDVAVQENPSSRGTEVRKAEEAQAANVLRNNDNAGAGNLLETSRLQTDRHSLEAKQLTTAQSTQEAGASALSKSFEVGQLPTAVFALGECVVDEEFRAIAHLNVSSLVARKQPSNGSGKDTECMPAKAGNRSAEMFAASLGLETSSVLAFDASVSESCDWKCDLLRNELVQDAKSNRLWLASFHGPAWLTQERRSHPLGAVCHRENNSIEFMVAGSITSNAKLHGQQLLVVGGFEDPQAHSENGSRLAEVINSDASSSSEVIERAKCLRDAGDWWLLIVDLSANKIVSCANRRNVYTLQESDFDSAVSTSGAGQEATCKSGVARLGLNLDSQEFVLETASDYHVAEHVISMQSALLQRSTQESMELNAAATSGEQTEQIEVSEKPGFVDGNVASRYILRMAPAPLRVASGRQPSWVGTALVVGNNPVARQLESRLRAIGLAVQRQDASEDEQLLKQQFLELTANGIVPHLFLTTPCDSDSTTVLDACAWKARRAKALLGNYWLCQEWLRHVVEAGVAHESSLVAVTTLGGEFGFGSNVRSAEGGGLAGLLKSMLIETWTQGIRPLPIKILDTDSKQSPAEVVDCIWRELATPSYDFEVSYRNGQRNVVRAIPRPLQVSKKSARRPSGTFVCTGGARGITAYVAEQLALRYDLNLQLLGTAPVPKVDPAWHHMDADGLRELRATVMKEARVNAKNPIRAWQDTEKAIEIDANLKRFQKLGIPATYYQCDVSDRSQVVSVLEKIRAVAGPIRGVLHGAGVGKDARFDRKQPGKVEQCIAAKVDGAITLMDATQDDPLEYFVGFGSISGRFGANGHTDYSLANEMLCKQIDWFKQQRPQVKAVGFHWHAWGDVGMATKPETRLALEMIDMQFMPANEGIEHLVNELESDENETEVLITDDRYYRMFFPAETLVDKSPASSGNPKHNGKTHPKIATAEILRTPMLQQPREAASGDGKVFDIVVDSVKDPFLSDHLLDGKPLLPFVVAAEMLFEGASRALGQPVKEIREIQAVSALRFFEDGEKCLHLETSENGNGQADCQLFCDFHARDGRLVQANRLHFSACGVASKGHHSEVMLQSNGSQNWETVQYPDIDSQFYVGWSLRRLRSVALSDDGLVGRISAPALIELAGATRDLRGWILPCAAMDACLFATGILAWQRVAPGSALPSRIGLLQVGRQPDPGEACDVHIRLNSASSGKASFDFTLYGVDGAMILNALDYEVAWIGGQSVASKQEKSQAR